MFCQCEILLYYFWRKGEKNRKRKSLRITMEFRHPSRASRFTRFQCIIIVSFRCLLNQNFSMNIFFHFSYSLLLPFYSSIFLSILFAAEQLVFLFSFSSSSPWLLVHFCLVFVVFFHLMCSYSRAFQLDFHSTTSLPLTRTTIEHE